MKKIFSFLLIGLALIGIFLWVREDSSQNTQIQDLKAPQDATLYVQEMQEFQSPQTLQILKDEYLKKFFAPFSNLTPNLDKQEVFWMQGSLKKYPGYGENLKSNSLDFTQSILQSMQLDRYPSVSQMAIITKDTDVRAVPTIKPRFSKLNGYPFDRWQNSSIFYGTPVLITHYDTSGRYAHIQTEFVYGWVEVSNLALVSKTQAQELLKIKNFVMPNNDTQEIKNQRGQYITQMRIGKLFMLDEAERMLVFQRTASGDLKISKINIDLTLFHVFPQKFSSRETAQYINLLMGQKYGWGGMYENRDCSSFLRDIFANFGLYLPRNSYAQAQYGTHQIELNNLSLSQKKEVILRNATPFATLVWFKGHIMLYIGKNQKGELMVAHSGWSVQSGDIRGKREHKLGGVVITTLEPAKEHNGFFFKTPSIGDRVGIINNLYPELKKANNSF